MKDNQESVQEKPVTRPWYFEALQMFTKLSGWVLVPLIAGYTIGRFLDTKYNSQPKWFFISVGIAFIFSTIGIAYQAQIEYRKITPPKK